MEDQGISIFKIYKADATYNGNNLVINLYYPKNLVELKTRLPGNSKFGANALEQLLKEGHTQIASLESPIKPADGGSMYVFDDDVFLVHRRHFPLGKNSLHNFYHSAPGGYTDSLNATFSEEGLIETGLRETAEEQLLVTRDYKRLITRKGSEEYSILAAKTIGIDLPTKSVEMQVLPATDTLNVFWEDGESIFSSKGKVILDPIWDCSTSLSGMQVIRVPLKSKDVYPIDAEGMIGKDGKFIHFNRESYFIPMSEVANKKFGTPLINFEVFKTKIEDGKPVVYTPTLEMHIPFYGPEEKIVNHPHIWAPENHTTVCLDNLGVSGFAGKRLDIQLWKEKCVRDGTLMIPEEFLVKKNIGKKNA